MSKLGLQKKWGLNVDANSLKLQERKDAVLLLTFLHVCDDYDCAIRKFKEVWLNTIYELPATTSENYNSVKCLRSIVLKRIKTVYNNYIVRIK